MAPRTSGDWFAFRRPGFTAPVIGSPTHDVAEVLHAGGAAEANAAHIVKACNLHDALVAALEKLVGHAAHYASMPPSPACTHSDVANARALLRKAAEPASWNPATPA